MAHYKTIAATLLAVSSLSAGESWHKARTAGQIVLAAMATVDIGSSVRLREVNPITGPSSRFGFRQGAVLGGMSAGSLLAQWWMLRHRETPALDREFTLIDLSASGLHGWAAWHNVKQYH